MKTIQKSDFFKVALAAVLIEKGFNLRGEDLPKIDELAQSIATIGQKTPIEGFKVRGEDKFVLTAGHRRMAAIELANKKYIGKPGYLQKPITHVNLMAGAKDEKTRTLTMMLDGQTEKLTNPELAAGCQRLKDMGMKPAEIGSAIGKSQAQVYNLLAIMKAPQVVQDLFNEGLISAALVNQIQREAKGDEAKQVKMAEEAVGNVEEAAPAPATGGAATPAAKPAKKKKATAKNASVKKTPAAIAKLEEALSLVDKQNAKTATLQAVVNKLKSGASAEDIAKLLK